jgi:predicted N-acyltransferase
MPDLNAALTQLCRQERRLLITVGNVDANAVSSWQRAGFLASPKPRVNVLDLPATYEDYLKSLRRKERQELRRIRRRAAEFDIRLEVEALGNDVEEIYTLLCEVYARHGVPRDAMPFTPQFLSALAVEMPGEIVLICGYAGDERVGVFLNLLDGSRLLALLAGLRYKIARPSYLYFVLLDETIRWGIRQGFQQVYVGVSNEREKRKHGFHSEERWLCYRANLRPLQRLLPVAYQMLQRSGKSSSE